MHNQKINRKTQEMLMDQYNKIYRAARNDSIKAKLEAIKYEIVRSFPENAKSADAAVLESIRISMDALYAEVMDGDAMVAASMIESIVQGIRLRQVVNLKKSKRAMSSIEEDEVREALDNLRENTNLRGERFAEIESALAGTIAKIKGAYAKNPNRRSFYVNAELAILEAACQGSSILDIKRAIKGLEAGIAENRSVLVSVFGSSALDKAIAKLNAETVDVSLKVNDNKETILDYEEQRVNIAKRLALLDRNRNAAEFKILYDQAVSIASMRSNFEGSSSRLTNYYTNLKNVLGLLGLVRGAMTPAERKIFADRINLDMIRSNKKDEQGKYYVQSLIEDLTAIRDRMGDGIIYDTNPTDVNNGVIDESVLSDLLAIGNEALQKEQIANDLKSEIQQEQTKIY